MTKTLQMQNNLVNWTSQYSPQAAVAGVSSATSKDFVVATWERIRALRGFAGEYELDVVCSDVDGFLEKAQQLRFEMTSSESNLEGDNTQYIRLSIPSAKIMPMPLDLVHTQFNSRTPSAVSLIAHLKVIADIDLNIFKNDFSHNPKLKDAIKILSQKFEDYQTHFATHRNGLQACLDKYMDESILAVLTGMDGMVEGYSFYHLIDELGLDKEQVNKSYELIKQHGFDSALDWCDFHWGTPVALGHDAFQDGYSKELEITLKRDLNTPEKTPVFFKINIGFAQLEPMLKKGWLNHLASTLNVEFVGEHLAANCMHQYHFYADGTATYKIINSKKAIREHLNKNQNKHVVARAHEEMETNLNNQDAVGEILGC